MTTKTQVRASVSSRPRILPTPTSVRFIKLGKKGKYEESCITGQPPCIRLGFRSGQHAESLRGEWDLVRHYWATTGGKTKGTATDFTNQIRTFYTADEQTLWITFWCRKLYWCFASNVVEELGDGTRIRKTLGNWSCTDVNGSELLIENLSGALTKVQGFRGTICSVDQDAYLLKRLNGESLLDVEEAVDALNELEGAVDKLVRRLGWKDFELLSDLIFTRAGWQRVGALGRTQKTVDLELLSPVTGRRAWVQVKSQSTLEVFEKYSAEFRLMRQFDEMFFVVHSPTKDLEDLESEATVHVIAGRRLAKLVVSAGLVNWLILKAQ